MKTSIWNKGVLVAVLMVGAASLAALNAGEARDEAEPALPADAEAEAAEAPEQPDPPTPVEPKPLSEQVNKGLAYLVNQQHPSGGWGQGGGWRVGEKGGRVEGQNVQDPPDVGNTCIAALALIRAGNTPTEGPYAKNLARAVEFIMAQVQESDDESLYVTSIRGTQLQSKIGQYVDTFLATLVLSELKGQMPDEKAEETLLASLDKAVGKIEKHQKADGTFEGNAGWASILSQGLCGKALNRAKQQGVMVRQDALDKDLDGTLALLDRKTGEFKSAPGTEVAGRVVAGAALTGPEVGRPVGLAGARAAAPAAGPAAPSDAGVQLYTFAANSGRLQERVNSLADDERRLRKVLDSDEAPPEEKAQARDQLKRFSEVWAANEASVRGIVSRLDDRNFVAGFGNNGGEEFLSFMNISETLLARGGAEWEKWDKAMTDSLNRIQNDDGSWSGHHCITGRTFCTAAALLTLMADRAPVPVAMAEETDEPSEK